MKLALLAIAALLAFPTVLSAQADGRSKIGISATLEAIRATPGHRVYQYLLWNRRITQRPLGHAFTSCNVGPGNVRICTSTYSLPLGRIVVVSEMHSLRRFSGVITGGSRSRRAAREGRAGYIGAAGTATSTRLGPGTYALTFVLE